MNEKISIIDQGYISSRYHLYHIGIHNMIDKISYTDDEIEQICQCIKEKLIEELKNIK